MTARIGYTVVGGFLGAGKTTMINSILASTTERLAVVVNDLGEVNVDASLIRSATDDTIELTNGCICCSLGDSLATTLRELCARPSPPVRILVECSGVADPASVATYGSRRSLDDPSIVVVVDATDVRARAEDRRFSALVEAQLAGADLLAVSKTDRVTMQEVDQLCGWLAERTSAPIVLGHPRELGVALPRERMTRSVDAPAVRTATRSFPGVVDVDEIDTWLSSIDGLVRAKGIVATTAGPAVVQWSAGTLEFSPWPNELVLGAVVTISATR